MTANVGTKLGSTFAIILHLQALQILCQPKISPYFCTEIAGYGKKMSYTYYNSQLICLTLQVE